MIAVPTPQAFGGEEGDVAAQPNQRPGRAEAPAAASVTTNPQDASEIARSGIARSGVARGGIAVVIESDGEYDSSYGVGTKAQLL